MRDLQIIYSDSILSRIENKLQCMKGGRKIEVSYNHNNKLSCQYLQVDKKIAD